MLDTVTRYMFALEPKKEVGEIRELLKGLHDVQRNDAIRRL